MDDGSELWAEIGCEYGGAVIIIEGLWCETMAGCCMPLAEAVAPAWDDVPARLDWIGGSLVTTCCWVRLDGGGGCSCGRRHTPCMYSDRMPRC